LLHSLLLSLPGSPVMYYGDEIGMGDNIYLGDRNGVRTPMQWSGDRNAGFSRADPSQLYQPLIIDPIYNYQAINVESQLRTSTSLLHWLRNMIRLRRKHTAFGQGTMKFVECTNSKAVAYIREDAQDTILVINNLSRFSQPVELELRDYEGCTLIEMIGEQEFPAIRQERYFMTLSPHSFFWFRLAKP